MGEKESKAKFYTAIRYNYQIYQRIYQSISKQTLLIPINTIQPQNQANPNHRKIEIRIKNKLKI